MLTQISLMRPWKAGLCCRSGWCSGLLASHHCQTQLYSSSSTEVWDMETWNGRSFWESIFFLYQKPFDLILKQLHLLENKVCLWIWKTFLLSGNNRCSTDNQEWSLESVMKHTNSLNFKCGWPDSKLIWSPWRRPIKCDSFSSTAPHVHRIGAIPPVHLNGTQP